MRRSVVLSSSIAWFGLISAACSAEESAPPGSSTAGISAVGGAPSGDGGKVGSTGGAAGTTGGVSGVPSGGSGGSTPPAGGGSPSASGGAPVASGGVPAAGGVAGAPSTGGGGAAAGSGGGAKALPEPKNLDHCLYGYPALESDKTMKSGPALYTSKSGGQPDTIMQPEVLQWMEDNKWTGAHVVWHAVRGCTSGTAGGLLGPLGFPDICQDYPVLVPTDQNCRTAGDGYQFLLFHRHMIQVLKQLWPSHAADFDGFPKFPTTKEELPEVWNEKDPTWSQTILDAAAIGDNIEQNLDKFPSEGALGYWLQCPVGSNKPSWAADVPYIGLHFNLHDQWSRGASSDHGLNNGQVNITNYMFWKLHGWIDKVWEKYRVAKGLNKEGSPELAKYRSDLAAQCREMDIEIEILKQNAGQGPMLDCPPDVDETGEFHTKVRPLFETDANHCSSCHGPAQTSPYAGLTLGGSVSSKCVLERLKRASIGGGQYKLIEPGDPSKSWLYLKASGLAEAAGCTSSDPNKPCNSATMPPSGKTMTDAELKILSDWITAGANP
jgi:hypothetical protein